MLNVVNCRVEQDKQQPNVLEVTFANNTTAQFKTGSGGLFELINEDTPEEMIQWMNTLKKATRVFYFDQLCKGVRRHVGSVNSKFERDYHQPTLCQRMDSTEYSYF